MVLVWTWTKYVCSPGGVTAFIALPLRNAVQSVPSCDQICPLLMKNMHHHLSGFIVLSFNDNKFLKNQAFTEAHDYPSTSFCVTFPMHNGVI